jgi:Phosphoesterase family
MLGRFRRKSRVQSLAVALSAALLVTLGVLTPFESAVAGAGGPTSVGGLSAGAIKHVWLIILENKSYDETFTGLNSNSYLWQTLPSEGVLLKNYYGTGHTSMDNYLSLASGQAPEQDSQNDCSYAATPFGSNSTIVTTGSVGSATPNWNYGQVASAQGPNYPTGTVYNNTTSPPTITASNGCIYPTDTPTLFDQFNAAGVSWKGYAQDLGGAQPIGSTSFVADSVSGREDGLCGAPGSSSNNPVTNPTLMSDTSTFPADVSNLTSASLVKGTGTTNDPQYSDQYVAKHFPFPWFASLTGGGTGDPMGTPLTEPQASAGGGTNCDSNHIANLDDPNEGLVHDLNANTVPQFSWITPDNCSDAHDTTCKGNNLSGAFGTYASGPHMGQVNLNDPLYTNAQRVAAGEPSGLPDYDPEATTPVNFTGGLYASDLFLAYYVPLIEQSAAYADGGLIDITFDEGEPPFTYSGNTFNNVLTNSSTVTGTPAMPAGQGTSSPQSSPPADAPSYGSGGTYPGADSIYGAYSIAADSAGENISGTNVTVEPTGPNSPLATDGSGNQLDPGPGFNLDVDRPPTCTSTSPNVPTDCVPNIVRGDAGSSPGPRTDTVTGGAGSSMISYPTPASGNPVLVGDDTGREITSITIGGTAVAYGSSTYIADFPNGLFVGTVSDTGELYPTNSSGPTVAASFQAIDDAGNPVDIAGSVTSVTLSGEGDPALLSSLSTPTAPVTADPLFDATDPTNGGGDTGSVLISPFIKPGSVSTTFYNHYSWLRTMEDMFDVSSCVGSSTDVSLPTGSVCGGLDGEGHIGYAAQTGLEPFGSDVFTAPSGNGFLPPLPTNPGEGLPEAPLAVAFPALVLLLLGGYAVLRRRRNPALSG